MEKKCLVCGQTFENLQTWTEHCKETHGFDDVFLLMQMEMQRQMKQEEEKTKQLEIEKEDEFRMKMQMKQEEEKTKQLEIEKEYEYRMLRQMKWEEKKTKQLQNEKEYEFRMHKRKLALAEKMKAEENQRHLMDIKEEIIKPYLQPRKIEITTESRGLFTTDVKTETREIHPDIASVYKKFNIAGSLPIT